MTVSNEPQPVAFAVWRRVDVPNGLGYGSAHGMASGFRLQATEVVHSEATAYSVTFTVEADTTWSTTAVRATSIGPTGCNELTLRRSAEGCWSRNGRELTELEGCVDVDIAATPLTNTLAINRLGLDVGQSAQLRVAWIDVPSLDVTLSRQRYERLRASGRYERYIYSDDTYGPYVLTVDRDGLVADYEALAGRVWHSGSTGS